ncbi:MAG: Ni/Fe-hydrogenase cytochrome b subunit [Acidobacteria bacterium]|nr:MAG: Ni/Fe-hydrogenase cytochrome b subunit [Acidobacteriota bacterium]PYX41830.1 MAG: Ni/Fe-hydrogenase cytochrome b subunit [Acidobacteriota bacterium]
MKIKFTFWKLVFLALMAAGFYGTVVRFAQGLGRSTNLNDQFPWGLWIGFDVLCGVMLAAGGFTLTAAVHIFNIKRLQPIVRPTILTAFLGYVLVCVALMYDLGRPYRIWHPLVMRNPHSVMFEVAYCVMLYTTVLSLEFSPIVLERFNLQKPLKIIRAALIPLVILGVILSTLHQSSLGTLYLIMPEKLHPLWYSPLLPVFFFISAIAVGLAMTIFESSLSAKYFGRQLELPILQELGRVLVVVLCVYGILRYEDLLHRGVLKLVLRPGYEMYLFWLEMSLSLIFPLLLLSQKKIRTTAQGLYLAAVLVVLGFITNRLNVSITGLESAAGMHYVPKWTEVAVTGAIIAAGFALFGLAVKYLPIFPAEESHPLAQLEVIGATPVLGHAGD